MSAKQPKPKLLTKNKYNQLIAIAAIIVTVAGTIVAALVGGYNAWEQAMQAYDYLIKKNGQYYQAYLDCARVCGEMKYWKESLWKICLFVRQNKGLS
jgi:hypothetical protein